MFRLDTGARAATQELLFLHVSLKERRVTPFPPELYARVHAAAASHAALPRPDWVGRHVGMRR
jgi:acyl-CoA thioester hydrolase